MRKLLSILFSLTILFSFSIGLVAMEYDEAPMLQEKVEDGKLPSVEERLPKEPMVIEPNNEIGQYGGTLVRGNIPNGEANFILDREAKETIPNIAKDWEFSEEGKVLTIYLREGMKWSDGKSLTAEDYLFNYNHVLLNENLNEITPDWMKVNDEIIEMEKIDEYTIQLKFAQPFYAVLHKMNLVGRRNYFRPRPKHFLKKYHIEFNENADEIAAEEGFDSWYQYFSLITNIEGDDRNFAGGKLGVPTLNAWVFKEEAPTTVIYERNPYYYKVDSEGNQLPYINEHHWDLIEDREVRIMKTLNGELDFVAWGTSVEDFPILKKNADQGNYEVWLGEGLQGAEATFCLNQTYDKDPILGELLRTKEFRQALSLAIDRQEINNLIYLGQSVPRQATVHPDIPGYKEEWAQSFAEFDPERAKKLLNEIGLDEKNSEGWRLGKDGEPVTIELLYHEAGHWVPVVELVREFWRNIGINVNMRSVSIQNLLNMVSANELPVFTWVLDRVHGPAFIESRGSWLNPNFWFGPIGPAWSNWFADPETGQEPPEKVKEIKNKADQLPFVTPEKQKEIIQIIGDAYAENLWMIGTVGLTGVPVVVDEKLGNVRKDAYPDNISIGGTRNQWMEQFYWKE